MQNKVPAAPIEYTEDVGGAQAPSIDLLAILAAVLRRWKLVAAITLSALIATYGVVKLIVPSRYKSTVEILVYDPQRQIDATVQKPISPFVDAVGNDAMNTEINSSSPNQSRYASPGSLASTRTRSSNPTAFESGIWRIGFESRIWPRTVWNCGFGGTAWFPRLGPGQ